jgi:hypothetical protein
MKTSEEVLLNPETIGLVTGVRVKITKIAIKEGKRSGIEVG